MDSDVKALLGDLFVEGRTYEVVVTTVRKKGKGAPNAAAMGVVRQGSDLQMRVFKGTDTFDNLRKLRRIGVNVVTVDEVDLLARAALFGWHSGEEEFPADRYENLRGFPFLKAAAVHLDCKVEGWTETYGKDEYGSYHVATFKAVVERHRVVKGGTVPLTRDGSPILEALVATTRWRVSEGGVREFLRERIERALADAKAGNRQSDMRAAGIIEGYLRTHGR